LDDRYRDRFDNVISTAISTLTVDGQQLRPLRVDVSKSGDSILTDIADGIAHSRLVLADVSTIGRDSVTGRPYRNGNVMYEVGLALACRHSSEVLLLRDDHDPFLFDVSTVPHVTIDFGNTPQAISVLTGEIQARLKEQQFHRDARVQRALASLSSEEVTFLKQCHDYAVDTVWGREMKGLATWHALATGRLLDKGIVQFAGGEFPDEKQAKPAFRFTPLGYVIKTMVNSGLRRYSARQPSTQATPVEPDA
jgi:hypothetical protein